MNLAKFLEAAFEAINSPYIWQAKGTKLWTPSGLVPLPSDAGARAFDCSGLVSWAMYISGGPDHRATHNAEAMFRAYPPTELYDRAHLRFYGKPDHVTHVAIAVPINNTGVWDLEAAGGDHTVTSWVEAKYKNAKVRFAPPKRLDFVGTRALP